MPYAQAGQWGYLRVLPAGDRKIIPLNSGGPRIKAAEVLQEEDLIPVSLRQK
jgi:hypothetical protein